MRFVHITLLCLLLVGIAIPASATITFTLGNNPQPGEENVLLNNNQLGSNVTGTTDTSGITVQFSSSIDTLTVPSNGQARVGAQDGAVNDITVTVPGGTFMDLIANPLNGSGTATVTVMDNLGTTSIFTYPLGNGQNFLTIVASAGETIDWVNFNAPGGFSDLRQPRISGAAVPEPSSLLLLGTGLLGLAGVIRRKASR